MANFDRVLSQKDLAKNEVFVHFQSNSQILTGFQKPRDPVWIRHRSLMVRNYSEQNKNTFQKLLGDVNWDIELEHKNVNEAMMTFNQKITDAYNKSFPFKRLSRKRAKDKPWITTGFKESIKQKHLLYQ